MWWISLCVCVGPLHADHSFIIQMTFFRENECQNYRKMKQESHSLCSSRADLVVGDGGGKISIIHLHLKTPKNAFIMKYCLLKTAECRRACLCLFLVLLTVFLLFPLTALTKAFASCSVFTTSFNKVHHGFLGLIALWNNAAKHAKNECSLHSCEGCSIYLFRLFNKIFVII